MSANLEALNQEAQALRAAIDGNRVDEAAKLLSQLKIALTTLPALPPCGVASPTAQQELELARHVLESATLLSILREDMTAFERSVIQLKVYHRGGLPPSPLHFPILGSRLLQLLVENRMAEFHNELELLPEQSRQDANVAFAVKLEQYLMEGTYNKVLEARANVPNPFFRFFLAQLLQTVRENIADCAEVAYQCLSLADAQQMLIFDSPAELSAYIQEEKPDWLVREGRVWFKAPEKSLGAADIPSLRLVGETLAYATELDRIV
ncbi:putative 26S proteasome non-ATPase regulatory subunit [Phytophthora cinnamomi]|uniref:putative 26S proteasome non-ATPase regulatory subunit n=1 Tax=Phytophthora cinnamomi TaxID=4785 RepID=UPI0035595228|nr:putative 26S proteasome non-ATPase regulatory subunit [Phytophthora cinnamomi]